MLLRSQGTLQAAIIWPARRGLKFTPLAPTATLSVAVSYGWPLAAARPCVAGPFPPSATGGPTLPGRRCCAPRAPQAPFFAMKPPQRSSATG